jgi:Cytochrome c7 and related cytochrome c
MPQVFHHSMNTVSRLSIVVVAMVGGAVPPLAYFVNQSPNETLVKVIRDQPVPFSHEHHTRGLGIDCRYCHTSVEVSNSAGMPPTYTCMSCHSQIWKNAPMLEPVRASLREDKPLHWTRVHQVPDFVYFNHGIHVQKGVGCSECHGRIDKMPLAWKEKPLSMEWCLECHRDPAQHVRPKEAVFVMDWATNHEDLEKYLEQYKVADRAELGKKLVKDYGIEDGRLDNCSICHR